MSWKKFILIGDSNTQFAHGQSGWINSVSDLFQRKCDIVNRGFSGYNSNQIRIIVPKILHEFKPEMVCGIIVMLGSNDSTDPKALAQHVDLKRFSENMSNIADYILNWGLPKNRLIFVSPAKIYDEKWQKVMGPNAFHFDHLVKDYALEVIKIAKKKSIDFFDFRQAMEEFGSDYHKLLHDGLHLSRQGGDLLFKGLLPFLNNISNDLKINFPDWKNLYPDQAEIDQ
ncbi:isoamyl acetate-hydrolyzing esterase 1 -like protein [Brachionus plicatilis]|uniref:Isoamyl acetate-hydrolyzing esterase 1-like protein n=1 Tax=Brachionus plicatilis TaxID=10195 RepID=A0A3M7P7A5_BRAPC|nr:isoamyl acetate-hydrolyzing esterase 1 -like protein [Brachionus plicatilis]